jgi:hypothetical protein
MHNMSLVAHSTPHMRMYVNRSWIHNTMTTVMIAMTIGGSSIVGLALLLSLVRTVERGLLLGACGGGAGERARRSSQQLHPPGNPVKSTAGCGQDLGSRADRTAHSRCF